MPFDRFFLHSILHSHTVQAFVGGDREGFLEVPPVNDLEEERSGRGGEVVEMPCKMSKRSNSNETSRSSLLSLLSHLKNRTESRKETGARSARLRYTVRSLKCLS